MAKEESVTGFRTFAIEPPYQVRSIRKMLETRQKELVEQLAGGYAKDWADYCGRVGEINGLLQATLFCDEIEKAERK